MGKDDWHRFQLQDRVRVIGKPEVYTVEYIHEMPGDNYYHVQFGTDFASRIWVKESKLETAD